LNNLYANKKTNGKAKEISKDGRFYLGGKKIASKLPRQLPQKTLKPLKISD
jgi:hypothetical protein